MVSNVISDCSIVFVNVGSTYHNVCMSIYILTLCYPREELFICSKLWNNKHYPEDIVADCKNTLEELGLEYVDLFLMHYPHAYRRGEEMFPADEEGTRLV